MNTLYKYLIIALVILLMASAGGGYYVYQKWETSKENLVKEQEKTRRLLELTKEQEDTISDIRNQNKIIARENETLNRNILQLERDYIDFQKQNDQAIDESNDQDTEQAEKTLNDTLDRVMKKLESAGK